MSVVFAVSGDWALASDGYQWIVQRRAHWKGKVQWRSLSFVHSTKPSWPGACVKKAAH